MKNKFLASILVLSFGIIISCKKGPGSGGTSSIHGNLTVIKYNAFYTDTLAIYAGYDQDVYIIYGNDLSYGDHIKSAPDGNFEFQYLREGKYKIYVYSDDSVHTSAVPPKISIEKNIEITSKNQDVNAGTFEIKSH